VAERLGLPLAILLRRVEAGDIPGRRVETPDGVRWSIRLSDLGIDPEEPEGNGAAPEPEPPAAPVSHVNEATTLSPTVRNSPHVTGALMPLKNRWIASLPRPGTRGPTRWCPLPPRSSPRWRSLLPARRAPLRLHLRRAL